MTNEGLLKHQNKIRRPRISDYKLKPDQKLMEFTNEIAGVKGRHIHMESKLKNELVHGEILKHVFASNLAISSNVLFQENVFQTKRYSLISLTYTKFVTNLTFAMFHDCNYS